MVDDDRNRTEGFSGKLTKISEVFSSTFNSDIHEHDKSWCIELVSSFGIVIAGEYNCFRNTIHRILIRQRSPEGKGNATDSLFNELWRHTICSVILVMNISIRFEHFHLFVTFIS